MENNSTLERITLRNTAGEAIGTIAFNPHDLEIAWRMQSAADVAEAMEVYNHGRQRQQQ